MTLFAAVNQLPAMHELLANNPLVLMEGAIVEQLRRSAGVELHPLLANAPLIYEPAAADAMAALYRQYMELAQQAGLPMLVCTPTWRAGRDRVQKAGITDSINQDAAGFMRNIRTGGDVRIGGMIGCRNDCYTPGAGLSADESQQFHAWQIEQLTAGQVDFLIAVTLPNVQEALGIARAMAATAAPYIISFVISRDGRVLDGTTLEAAIDLIDNNSERKPLGYMVNCAHPSFLCPQNQSQEVFGRLIGFQANASSLDHCELENASQLQADSLDDWGTKMLELNETYGVQILGGCCGTDIKHLQYLVEHQNGKAVDQERGGD